MKIKPSKHIFSELQKLLEKNSFSHFSNYRHEVKLPSDFFSTIDLYFIGGRYFQEEILAIFSKIFHMMQ